MRQLFDRSASASAGVEGRSAGDLLVERWQQGNDCEESFRQLYLLYYRKVYRFFVRRGFPADECMDLAQETFLRVHQHLGSFRHDSPFAAWLFKIAANLYRNRLRSLSTRKREGHEVPLEDAYPGKLAAALPEGGAATASEEGPLCEILSEERVKVLREALDDLPAQMRRCVLLRVKGDLKYREIAVLMQVSVETVKTHLFQARQQLKGRLADYFTEIDL